MIVDDTVTYRTILKQVIRDIPEAEVVETAVNGRDALEKLNTTPVDMVLLDVEMPELNGLETLKCIRQGSFRQVAVVMVSGANRASANITMECLQAGALDFIPKPEGSNMSESVTLLRDKLVPLFLQQLVEQQKPLLPRQPLYQAQAVQRSPLFYKADATAPSSQETETVGFASATVSQSASRSVTTPTPLVKRGGLSPCPPIERSVVLPRAASPEKPLAPTPGRLPGRIDAIAIGVSTGGPRALMELVPALSAQLQVPIYIVIHMPPVFTTSLADRLNQMSPLRVVEGAEGMRVEDNTVVLAPGGHHMVLTRPGVLGLTQNAPVNSCRPAVDVLFESMASVYGGNVLSVILTGMGSDGAKGVQALKAQGAYCLNQTEGSCVVYGMPRAVDELGLADEQVDLAQMASRINTVVNRVNRGR